MLSGFPRFHQHASCVGVRDKCSLVTTYSTRASLDYSLAAQQAFNTLLTVLHYHVEIVVGNQVFDYSNRTGFVLILQRHGPLNLHHHTLLIVWVPLIEVLELLDKEEGLRVLISRDVRFDWWKDFLDSVRLQLWLSTTQRAQVQMFGCR